jgi:hypothetical protein
VINWVIYFLGLNRSSGPFELAKAQEEKKITEGLPQGEERRKREMAEPYNPMTYELMAMPKVGPVIGILASDTIFRFTNILRNEFWKELDKYRDPE